MASKTFEHYGFRGTGRAGCRGTRLTDAPLHCCKAGRTDPYEPRDLDDELDPPLPPAPVGILECLVVIDLGPSPSQVGYCTRVGVYWPGVVRTARDPDLREVHPNAGQ